MNGFDYIHSLTIEQLALFLHNIEAMAIDTAIDLVEAQPVEAWERWLRFGDEGE